MHYCSKLRRKERIISCKREQNIDPFCREYFRAVVVAAFICSCTQHEEPSIRNDGRNPALVHLISPVVGVLANH